MPASSSHSHSEVEVKLRIADVAAFQRCLRRLRARESCPRTFELNTIYDTPGRDLARHRRLIRIRIERPSSSGGGKNSRGVVKSMLTYKGQPQSLRGAQTMPGKRGRAGRYKIREEIEVAIADREQMRLILLGLGLRPVFRYEKVRTTYTLPGIRGLKVEFDETPIGTFLELEGAPSAIDRAAKLLGYTRADYIAQTYGALYIAACRLGGHKPADMLFAVKKLR